MKQKQDEKTIENQNQVDEAEYETGKVLWVCNNP